MSLCSDWHDVLQKVSYRQGELAKSGLWLCHTPACHTDFLFDVDALRCVCLPPRLKPLNKQTQSWSWMECPRWVRLKPATWRDICEEQVDVSLNV